MALETEQIERIESHLREMERTERALLRAARDFAEQTLQLVSLCSEDRELARHARKESAGFASMVAGLEGLGIVRVLRRRVDSARRRAEEQRRRQGERERNATEQFVDQTTQVRDELEQALRRFLSS